MKQWACVKGQGLMTSLAQGPWAAYGEAAVLPLAEDAGTAP